MQNWDDLRFLLAVYRAGTMSAAARVLGTNVATVSRRIERLGDELGGSPFVKTPSGWRPDPLVAGLLEAAEAFEGQMQRELNASAEPDAKPPHILIGTPSLIASAILLPGLAAAPALIQKIDLEIMPRVFETGLGNHDVVVQAGRPASGRLAIRRAGSLRFGIYIWADTPPGSKWIGLTQNYRLLQSVDAAESYFGAPPALRLESMEQIFRAAQLLHLPAILPEILARQEPGLFRLEAPDLSFEFEFWIMYHLSRRGDPAVQVAVDWIVRAFEAIEPAVRLITQQERLPPGASRPLRAAGAK
jgi:DNA-binding transcriptional LysR family regulator